MTDESSFDLIFFLFYVFGPLLFFYLTGRFAEKRHYRSIQKREEAFLRLPALSLKKLPSLGPVQKIEMACGSVVISLDHFKRFLASLKTLVGGRISSYESLLDRARREAILRMKESCPDADLILNVRLETAGIGGNANNNKQIGSVEVLAYGTAIYLIEK